MSGIKIISEFELNKANPLDFRQVVADQTARLALKYPHKGLRVRQADTGQSFTYITTTPTDGTLPSNTVGDWELTQKFYSGSGAPATSLGVIGDVYIDEVGTTTYKKTGTSTWTALFGTNGSKFLFSAGTPSNANGNNGDININNINGDVYYKVSGAWVFQFNEKGTNGISDKYATTSATSVTLSTATAPLNMTIGTGLNYTVGQTVVVASRSTPADFFKAKITSYNSGTGAVVLGTLVITGTAVHADWDFNLDGVIGRQGTAFKHLESNINLTDAKVAAVTAGVWTPIAPWSASVATDTRASFVIPATLAGDMSGHSINWDGNQWWDNGSWVGPKGATGNTGPTGPVGPIGATGPQGNPSTVAGPVGPRGVAGPAGPQGFQGPQGPAGVGSPSTVMNGTGAPLTPGAALTVDFKYALPDFTSDNRYSPSIFAQGQFVCFGADVTLTMRLQYSLDGITWLTLTTNSFYLQKGIVATFSIAGHDVSSTVTRKYRVNVLGNNGFQYCSALNVLMTPILK